MNFHTKLELPIIDFSKENLKPGSESWLFASNEVRSALEEYGCFIAVYKKVPLELSKDVFDALKELFDLPFETKVKNVSDGNYGGYMKQRPKAPLYESFGIEGATTAGATEKFTNVLFSSGNENIRKVLHSYATLCSELEQMVNQMVFQSYDVENHYDTHVGSTIYTLRLMKYRVPQKDETNIGANAHTDKTFLSILHPNQVDGLEVKTKDGEWISIKFPPSSFVVMAGDAFLAWSNDRVHSVFHQVIMSGDEERYSLGLFSYIDGIIKTPEELVDERNPQRYKPFVHFGLLDFYKNNENPELGSSYLKDYYGV